MREAFFGTYLCVVLICWTLSGHLVAQNVSSSTSTDLPSPQISYQKTIDLHSMGGGSWIRMLAFSPDDRFLAIFDSINHSDAVLIIWDLEKHCEQARISGLNANFSGYDGYKILWFPDGKTLALVSNLADFRDRNSPSYLPLWDPMTGKTIQLVPDVHVFMGSRLNRDGSKLATYAGTKEHFDVRVYDTKTWQYKDFPIEAIGVGSKAMEWTAEDKILLIGHWNLHYRDSSLGELKMNDILITSIDPSSRENSKTTLLAPSIPTQPPSSYVPFSVDISPWYSAMDYVGNKVVMGGFKIIVFDARSLEKLYIFPPAGSDINDTKWPSGQFVFSPDGKYLYFLGGFDIHAPSGSRTSLILNAKTGQVIGSFFGGNTGLAISSSGKSLAIGNGQSVQIYSVSEEK